MYKIDTISDDTYQKHTLYLPDGDFFDLTIYYRSMQSGWFIESVEYQGFVVNSIRITNNVNILMPFVNKLPFGLACFSEENREPTLRGDFQTESSILYILDAGEVAELLRVLRG